ncbi:MAG: hypothetical protein LJE64_06475 [Desulfofustis sp.]|nr:hypothetical protein [Desulfofustis sp.]
MEPPPEVPVPPGDDYPDSLLSADISLNVVSRDTQVIAQVAVVDGIGQPAVDATVKEARSGVKTKGDTSRIPGSDGVATFYSTRSRAAGAVEFCVLDITWSRSTFNPDARLQIRETIEK